MRCPAEGATGVWVMSGLYSSGFLCVSSHYLILPQISSLVVYGLGVRAPTPKAQSLMFCQKKITAKHSRFIPWECQEIKQLKWYPCQYRGTVAPKACWIWRNWRCNRPDFGNNYNRRSEKQKGHFHLISLRWRDQALSLWSGSTDSKTIGYQRTNHREYHTVRTHTKETTWIQDPASPNHQ